MAPPFVRFCRALALLSGPFVPVVGLAIPTFVEGALVEGCSSVSNGPSGALITEPDDTGSRDGPGFDVAGPVDAPTLDAADSGLVDVDGADADLDAPESDDDASDAGDGGPRAAPDLPFFA